MEYAWGFAASRLPAARCPSQRSSLPEPQSTATTISSSGADDAASCHDTDSASSQTSTVSTGTGTSTNATPGQHHVYPYCSCHRTPQEANSTGSTGTTGGTGTTLATAGRPFTAGAPPGLQFFHRRPPSPAPRSSSTDLIISAAPVPVSVPVPVPVPDPDPVPGSVPDTIPATTGFGPDRHSGPPSSSPASSTSTSAVCLSCNKPFAGPGPGPGPGLGPGPGPNTNSPRPLSLASSFPLQQPQPAPVERDRWRSLHHRQQRRQSHPEISRTVPDLVVDHASEPLPPSRDQHHHHHHQASRTFGRSRLSAPQASTTPAYYSRGRYRGPTSSSHHATMVGVDTHSSSQNASASTSLSGRTLMSTNDNGPVSRDGGDTSSTKSHQSRPRKPFVTRSNGRTYLSDPTNPYPLPVDLHELHRQSLRTLLLFQLFGGPVCSPVFAQRPPTSVLDVGCGYGFWSMMTHSYFSRKGHSNIKFTGIDIAPLGGIAGIPHLGNAASPIPAKDRGSVSSATGNWAEQPPDKTMDWNFVQLDLRHMPLPFADEEFDLIMCKDLCLAVGTESFQACMDEYLRCLKPGGVLEVWDCDNPIRMLRPHVPDTPTTTATTTATTAGAAAAAAATTTTATTATTTKATPQPFDPVPSPSSAHGGEPFNGGVGGSKNKGEHAKEMSELGAYILGNNTPLSGPQNIYLIEYNSWMLKVLEQRQLLNWPCASIGPFLLQEPLLTNHGSKRLAIPLTEVRWEREGVGGVVTKDGKSYIDSSKAVGRAKGPLPDSSATEKKGKTLGEAQLALRETALHTVLGMIEGMEPALREVNEKKQDEWDAWMGKLRKELLERDGANCGECLEVGAWWSRKVTDPS